MATTTNTKPKAEKKPPVAASIRITDALKKGALGGKLSVDELDKLAKLADALKTFVSA